MVELVLCQAAQIYTDLFKKPLKSVLGASIYLFSCRKLCWVVKWYHTRPHHSSWLGVGPRLELYLQ